MSKVSVRRLPSSALAAAALLLLLLTACSKSEPPANPVRAVRTVTLTEQRRGGVQEFAGVIRARTESQLSFRVGGKMIKRLVNLGDTVKAGEVLAQLDPRDLQLGQQAARANVAAAEAAFDQTTADFARYKELNEKGFIGPAEFDRRAMGVKSARAQLDQAKAAAGVQVNQAGYASLTADASGVITGIELEPGMVAAAGTPVVQLARNGPRDVVFSVPEDQVGVVKSIGSAPGHVMVRLWGSKDAELPATIREISAAADPVTRTFLVKADLGKVAADQEVRLGQSATVQLTLPQEAGVIKLPLSALREVDGHSAVWLVDRASMTIRSHDVKLAGADGNEAVIAKGLEPGQIVVTAGVHVLNAGQKVSFYVDPRASTLMATPTENADSPRVGSR